MLKVCQLYLFWYVCQRKQDIFEKVLYLFFVNANLHFLTYIEIALLTTYLLNLIFHTQYEDVL